MCLCGRVVVYACVCVWPDSGSKQMKKGQTLLVCNASLSAPYPLKHICSQINTHTRSQTGTMWPPVPQHRQRRLLFDSVSAGPDKVSRQPSTELVLPPADQLDISTQTTSPSQIPLHNLLCTAVSYKWAVTHSVTQLAKLWSHASKDTDTHKEFKAALIIIFTWIGQIMYNGNCLQ